MRSIHLTSLRKVKKTFDDAEWSEGEDSREINDTIRYLEILSPNPTGKQLHEFVQRHPKRLANNGYVLLPTPPVAHSAPAFILSLLLWISDWLQKYADSLADRFWGLKIPMRYVALVGFFQYHTRVLDAWSKSTCLFCSPANC